MTFMKKSIFLPGILLFLACSGSSQIMEASKVMSKGQQSALSLEIPEVSADYAEEVYKDFIKEFKGKTKKDRKTNEWFSDDSRVPGIANGAPVDIYAQLESSGSKTVINMWVDLGSGYINSSTYPREYAEAGKLLEQFSHMVKIRQAEDELDMVEKDMKKLDGDLKKLKKDNEDYHKEIEKSNQKIKDAENAILKNEEDQKSKQAAIETQAQKVEEAKVKVNNLKKN